MKLRPRRIRTEPILRSKRRNATASRHCNLKRQPFRLKASPWSLAGSVPEHHGLEVALLKGMTVELMDPAARAEYEREIDLALAGSFPASDPLPWTLGVAMAPEAMRTDRYPLPRAAAVDVIVDARAAFGYRRRASIAEAMFLVALVPLAILLIGLPIVAAIRAAVSVVLRLTP